MNHVTDLGLLQRLCAEATDEQLMFELLDALLTLEEQRALADRCLIFQGLLKQENTQRELAQSLGVSIATITRGSNQLKKISPSLHKFLQHILLSGPKK